MAGEQTVADLRAVLSAHGFKEAERDMRAVKGQTKGVASGLKSLTQTMNKAGAGAEKTGKQQQRFGMKTNKLNQLVQQASFGIQDFAIVIGQGGLGMALRSASNNAAQMGAIMGGLGGAVAGVGVTLASLIPDLLHMFSTTDKGVGKLERFRKSIEDVNKELDVLAKKRRIQLQLDELKVKGGKERFEGARDFDQQATTAKQTAQATEKSMREFATKTLGDLERLDASAMTRLVETQRMGRSLPELLEQMESQRGEKPVVPQMLQDLFGPEGTKEIQKEMERDFAAGGVKPGHLPARQVIKKLAQVRFADSGLEGDSLKSAVDDFMKQMDDMAVTIRKAKVDAKLFTEAEKKANELAEDKAQRELKQEQADKAGKAAIEQQERHKKQQEDFVKQLKQDQKDIDKLNKEDAKAAEDANKNRIKSLKEEKAALEGVLEVLDPTASKLQKIKERFGEASEAITAGALARNPLDALGAALTGAGLAGAAAAKERADMQKKKPDPGISGTFDVADFSRQLQNALLKDDTAKQTASNTKQTAQNTSGITGKLDNINKSITTLKSLRGTFGP